MSSCTDLLIPGECDDVAIRLDGDGNEKFRLRGDPARMDPPGGVAERTKRDGLELERSLSYFDNCGGASVGSGDDPRALGLQGATSRRSWSRSN